MLVLLHQTFQDLPSASTCTHFLPLYNLHLNLVIGMARQKSAQISGIPVYHSAMQIRKVKAHVWVRGNSTHSKDKRDPDTLA